MCNQHNIVKIDKTRTFERLAYNLAHYFAHLFTRILKICISINYPRKYSEILYILYCDLTFSNYILSSFFDHKMQTDI